MPDKVKFYGKDGKLYALDELLPQDGITNALCVIDSTHHEIHAGCSYVVKGFTDLATNAVIDAQITTPDSTKISHLFAHFTTETEYQYYIYEGASIVTPGMAQTPRNRNRNYPDNSTVVVSTIENDTVVLADVDTPTVGAESIFPGITGAGKKAGGEERAEEEFVLKRNTIYCFRLVCISAGWADFEINWYEHTNLE